MTAQRNGARPPAITDITGEWMPADELINLPSVRGQFGLGHVNSDLTSLSWLALPPITVGYHTGVLRVNGEVIATERARWLPWGVQRQAAVENLTIESEVRLAADNRAILWRVSVTNEADSAAAVVLNQELAAMTATSEVDWGWLYGTPWNHGHHHDFFATESIRAQVLDGGGRQTHLIPGGERRVRLGKPRIPGIQRDEEGLAMTLDHALPAHTTSDRIAPDLPGAAVTVRAVRVGDAHGSQTDLVSDDIDILADSDLVVGSVSLGEGSTMSVDFQLREAGASGVIATHGNHPDSLQLGLQNGVPWLSIGGELLRAPDEIGSGWHTLTAKISAAGTELYLDDAAPLVTTPWWESERWLAQLDDGVTVHDRVTGADARYHFNTAPDSLRLDGSRAVGEWDLLLDPGETRAIEFALELDGGIARCGASGVDGWESRFVGVQAWWENTWEAAFTPDNEEFSGYLPILESEADLEKTYYTAVLEAIYVRNKQASEHGSIYLAGGPRLGPTTSFFWDLAEWSRVFALLDPAALRSWIRAALSLPYDSCMAMDMKNTLPIGNYYSANDYSLFRAVESYVGITGDVTVLSEQVAGRSVYDHVREMAFRPTTKRSAFGAGVLVDFGDDAWELLEAVPNYRHVVASFNAGYVGILRRFAVLAQYFHHNTDAERAQAMGDELAEAVVGQYAGDGRWLISHPEHDEPIGHCLDFQIVAAEMAQDLPTTVKAEMVTFVTERLIDGDWMRALDPDDPIAPFSDRPDHGSSGAFAAWPGNTAYGLIQLGEVDIATDFLSRLHRSTSGGLWGQAQEVKADGTYFVSEVDCHCREIVTGAAAAEAILAGLFGIRGGYEALTNPRGALEFSRGRVHNVRAIGFDLDRVSVLATA